jgi:hypothetical protein
MKKEAKSVSDLRDLFQEVSQDFRIEQTADDSFGYAD